MRGVVGVVDADVNEDVLSNAVATLAHRGPDATGIFLDKALGVGLGHRRLAIVDLETGDQPLFDHDQNIVLSVTARSTTSIAYAQSFGRKDIAFKPRATRKSSSSST